MNHFSPQGTRSLRSRTLGFAAVACMAGMGEAGAQAPIYLETFTNPTPATAKNFSTIGWNAHIGSTAIDFTNSTDITASGPAVIWTGNGQGGTAGYGFSNNALTGSLFWTTEIGSVSQDTVDSISFWSNNSTTTSSLRIAIRLDNNTPANFSDDLWFATSQAFVRNVGAEGGSSGNWATNGELELFSFTNVASAWRDISFTPGVSLNLAATARTEDLPSGNINAIGLYGIGNGLRFDTLQVVPEPSTLVLSVGALAGLLGIRRRRR